MDRIRGADLARVVACVSVFIHHLTFSVNAAYLPEKLQYARSLMEKGKFGVAIFFVLSGFLLGLPFWQRCDDGRDFQFGSYALMRTARIVPAAWVCFAVSLAVDLFYARNGNDFTALRFFTGLAFISNWHWLTMFPVHLNGPLWSLAFEISAYVFMPAAFLLCRSATRNRMRGWTARYIWSAVILVALLLHALAFVVLPQTDHATAARYGISATAAEWFPTYNAFGFFAMFAIGTLAAGVHTMVPVGAKVADIVRGGLVLVGAALLPTLVFSATVGQLSVPRPPFGFPALPIMAALFLFGIQHVRLGRLIDNRAIAFCAKISFGVYIWHTLILIFVTDGLRTYSMSGSVRLGLTGILALGLTVLLSWVSYSYFEEAVLLRARMWLNRSRPRSVANAGPGHPVRSVDLS